jgi:hypothetical protein
MRQNIIHRLEENEIHITVLADTQALTYHQSDYAL